MKRANTPTDYLSGLVPAEAAAKKFYLAKGEYELAFAGDAATFCKFMFLTADLWQNIINSRISTQLSRRLTLLFCFFFFPDGRFYRLSQVATLTLTSALRH